MYQDQEWSPYPRSEVVLLPRRISKRREEGQALVGAAEAAALIAGQHFCYIL